MQSTPCLVPKPPADAAERRDFWGGVYRAGNDRKYVYKSAKGKTEAESKTVRGRWSHETRTTALTEVK